MREIGTQQGLISFSKATFEKNKLTISDDLQIDEWKELGQSLRQIEGSVQFWIGDWARFGDKKGFTGKYVDSKVYDDLEEITGLERNTIQQYKSIAEKTSCTRVQDLNYAHHREVAKLAPAKQAEFLARASDEKLTVRELRQEVRKAEHAEKKPSAIPEGVFNIIYCDPPWQYDFAETDSRKIENQYPTMTIEDLCNMQLPNIDNNALLLMWATSPKLIEAISLIDAWGFKYKTHCVWDKGKIGMGYWFRGQHELLLVATRGSFSPPDPHNRNSSIYLEDRTTHSTKPEFFYRWIEESFSGNKIELFARNRRQGWEAWGNESI